MSFFSYMKTGNFWKQILLMLIIVVVLIGVSLLSLNIFTHHGREIKVADICGFKVEQLQPYTEEFGFRFVVRDSIYQPNVEPGTILLQSPLPGSIVKRKRTFYVVVAATQPASEQMPNLIDLSQRQAEALLETYGLKVGRVTSVDWVVKGSVVRQLYGGAEIAPGSSIRKGSVIDLEVGNGKAKWKSPKDTADMVLQESVSQEELFDEDFQNEMSDED